MKELIKEIVMQIEYGELRKFLPKGNGLIYENLFYNFFITIHKITGLTICPFYQNNLLWYQFVDGDKVFNKSKLNTTTTVSEVAGWYVDFKYVSEIKNIKEKFIAKILIDLSQGGNNG